MSRLLFHALHDRLDIHGLTRVGFSNEQEPGSWSWFLPECCGTRRSSVGNLRFVNNRRCFTISCELD